MLSGPGFLMVSSKVSSTRERFPVSCAGFPTWNLGNFSITLALEATFQGFLFWKLLRPRKPKVSSWFPDRFPKRRHST